MENAKIKEILNATFLAIFIQCVLTCFWAGSVSTDVIVYSATIRVEQSFLTPY